MGMMLCAIFYLAIFYLTKRDEIKANNNENWWKIKQIYSQKCSPRWRERLCEIVIGANDWANKNIANVKYVFLYLEEIANMTRHEPMNITAENLYIIQNSTYMRNLCRLFILILDLKFAEKKLNEWTQYDAPKRNSVAHELCVACALCWL